MNISSVCLLCRGLPEAPPTGMCFYSQIIFPLCEQVVGQMKEFYSNKAILKSYPNHDVTPKCHGMECKV
jgi:hypothetical protein